MFIRAGTRDSRLAKRQAETVVEKLDGLDGLRVDLVTDVTTGDERHQDRLEEFDQTGIFTRTLDEAVASGELDLAIHSLKDCPTDWPEELVLTAVPARGTPFDLLVGDNRTDLTELESGYVVGTSSRRRRASLLYLNQAIEVRQCRGNVPTRLEKLHDEDQPYDALVLASAGLERLGVEKVTTRVFRTEEMLPAAGQGALAIVTRKDNRELRSVVEVLEHAPSRASTTAERSLLNRLEAGCQAPVGALARVVSDRLELQAYVTEPEGRDRVEASIEGAPEEAVRLGIELAEEMLGSGVDRWIE